MVKKQKTLLRVGLISLIVLGICELAYFALFRNANVSLAEKIDLPSIQNPFGTPSGTPVCGDVPEMIVLAAGIDYRDDDYLYGLSDVIRVVHIDFTKPQVNVVPIPRNVLVTPPERLPMEGPLLINQTYFFGSPGMDKFQGPGKGAGALAETIYYSFGLRSDQYVVVDFRAFEKLIDTLGGVEVDLPVEVTDGSTEGYFPAGKQMLDGERALRLARSRKNSSDNARIDNQSIILKGIFNRLKDPATIIKLPQIYTSLKDSILTDLSPNQITTFICLVSKIKSEDIVFASPPQELLAEDWEFIPNLQQQMIIYRWDQRYIDWLKQSVYAVGQ